MKRWISLIIVAGMLFGQVMAFAESEEDRSGIFGRILSGLGEAAEDAADWASGAAGDAADWANGAAKDVADWANGFDASEWLSGAAEDVSAWANRAADETADWADEAADDFAAWASGALKGIADFLGTADTDNAEAVPSDEAQFSMADELIKLADLYEKGLLTEEEYTAAKTALLG